MPGTSTRPLYPDIEPYAVHVIERGRHDIYVEECGNPQGLPVLFLHGGPGSGCKPYHRCFFDPDLYRIILVDQRACGRSLPQGLLLDNTTEHLLNDLEHIRRRFDMEQWMLFGGSWGATLALLYAQAHPARVSALVLRGTFLARRRDLDWYAGEGGVRQIYPDTWEHLLGGVPSESRHDPVMGLYAAVTGRDELAQRRAARAWEHWGGQVVLADEYVHTEQSEHVDGHAVMQAGIELHYAVNRYFIEENQILQQCERIRHIPAVIIHGRRDLVCPLESAWTLHQHLPESELRILPHAGHIASTDDMIDALVSVSDEMAVRLGDIS